MIHTINIIQQHIDAGRRGSCFSCPTALALIQHFGKIVYVSKRHFEFFLGPPSERMQHTFPVHMILWIENFDSYIGGAFSVKPQPTSFTIQLP